ncbi:Rhomboid family protein [Gemmobacter megaterium]|uniref:Rhomboid family protein n=1 Tax=Gemmobacter megaterium TaxID=1086013 RepID=A0A1N7KSX4_9RHOB|nr:rhomboid family intramembrane serine protease [Gemmobacter megaterium]GGE03646.1 rhomboid family intramembrane serine protease [Gemmobacter megaterium]SIS64699.1 Rhomboid family protein [Gemmobacter megaterium]
MSQRPDHMEPPLNPLPPVVWALALPMIVLEAVLQLAEAGLIGGQNGVGWRLTVLSRMAFVPDQLAWMIETRQFPMADLSRLLAYSFAHVSLTHAAFVVVFVLALGKFVSEVFRPWAVAVLFLGSAIGAAVLYTLVLALVPALRLNTGQMLPLVGGYPAAFGMIGAFTFVLWLRLGGTGGPSWRAFTLIGMMMAVRLLFGILFGGGPDWVADLAGFGVGFGLSFLVVPGGPARLLAHLRER